MSSKLFQPITVGDITLKHRVVHCPLTRFRADKDHVPLPLVKEYYGQRASVPGTLLITEATLIRPEAGGYVHVPGIWSEAQISAWKEIVDKVHANESFIYLQLWALGRTGSPSGPLYEKSSHPFVSASNIPLSNYPDVAPRPLTVSEIKEYVQWYAKAASNAVHEAGFDGVEIHGAQGYLVDQFLQDVTNVRTDEYGGSVENRARFGLEVVDAVVKAVGPRKTAIRLSPWNTFNDMGMKDPKPTFAYFVSELKKTHPTLSYIHVVEPRVQGFEVLEAVPSEHSNDFIHEIWLSGPGGGGSEDDPNARRLISAGGFTRETGAQFADSKGTLIGYGRLFIANPDLPYRLEKDLPLNTPDRSTYYVPNDTSATGYTDYPFAERLEIAN